MTVTHAGQWLKLLEGAGMRVGCRHVDLLVDQAGCDVPLLEGIRQIEPAIPWRRLFEPLPEAGIAHVGPLLLRVDLQQRLQRFWLEQLIEAFSADSRLLALISAWSFERLASYLSQCLEARQGERVGVLRYYDPRLFPLLLSHVLEPGQQRQLLRPAVLWSWFDRDARPRHQAGLAEGADGFFDFQMIELSDAQLDRLHCASDAHDAVAALAGALPQQWQAEQRFQACFAAVLEAGQAGLMRDNQREAFVLDRIHGG